MTTPTPLRNAFFAAVYIAGITSLINFFGTMFGGTDDTIMAPMVMLSLLVLSVAIMGYLFVFEPVRMYAEGKKQEAIAFFGKTVGSFAIFVLIFVGLLFVTILR